MTSCFDEVTVLCIYYNSKNIIIEGLSSLMDAKKVIVVDNASTDGSAQAIEQALPSVTVIRSETNRGYGSGVNAGLEHVQTPYLLIVNPDANDRKSRC